MRRVLLTFIIISSIGINNFCFSESIKITTNKHVYYHEASLESEIIELYADSENVGAETLLSIQGVNKFSKCKQITITYFYDVKLQTIDCNTPISLVIQNSNVSNISEILLLNIDALLLQSCILPDNVMIYARNSKVQYLEITNSRFSSLPKYEGDIPIINFSFNKISKITSKDKKMYKGVKRVLLFRNPIEINDGLFVSTGNISDYIPRKWYQPQ